MRELLDLWVALRKGAKTTDWDTRELGRRKAARLVDDEGEVGDQLLSGSELPSVPVGSEVGWWWYWDVGAKSTFHVLTSPL